MPSRILPLAAMDKIMRKAGAPRVSDGAKEALASLLEREGIKISEKAIMYSQHAGRKTVTAADITLGGNHER